MKVKMLLILLVLVQYTMYAQNKVAFVKVFPEKIILQPGQTHQFTAKGYNCSDKQVPLQAEWQATGGSVTENGLYTAKKSGVHSVMASCAKSGASGSATVIVKGKMVGMGRFTKPAKKQLDSEYIKLISWDIKAGKPFHSFLIKVQVKKVGVIQAIIFHTNGKKQIIGKMPIMAAGMVAQFRGRFFLKTTKSMALVFLNNKGKKLFMYKKSFAKPTQVPTPKIHVVAIPGGYVAQKIESPEMQEVAKKAVSFLQKELPEAKLTKLHSAATQVVAGINYFLLIEVESKKAKSLWKMFIYRDFSGNYSLTTKQQVK